MTGKADRCGHVGAPLPAGRLAILSERRRSHRRKREPKPTQPMKLRNLTADPADVKLIAIDLDGTLLDSQKQIDPPTEAALRDCVKRGIQVVIASARPPRGVRHLYQQLGLTNWQVNYNGALIWDEPSRAPVFHRPMPASLCRGVIDVARDQFDEIGVHAEIMDKWFTDRPVEEYVTETGKLFTPDGIVPVEQFCTVPITKLMLMGETPMLMKLEPLLLQRFGDEVTIVSTDAHLMQLMDSRVSKATAIRKIAAHHRISTRQVMAIGDAPNDVGMLQIAGVAVAMENARDVVKKVAHWIAPSNDQRGVLTALQNFGLVR